MPKTLLRAPWVAAGFDYANAVLELRGIKSPYGVLTYDRIAEICGYESKSSIAEILTGHIPPHPQGEALYILYVETLHRKPPAKVRQSEPGDLVPAT